MQEGPNALNLFWIIFSQSELSIQKSQGSGKNLKVSKYNQAISVNIDQLYNKQMNEITDGSKADWDNFNISRIPKMEKQKTKFIVPAPIISASSIFIILSFSVNIDFGFIRKAFSQ